MANRYWVGGSGNWDATSTTNWAASSGGASGASAPTSADSVIFDQNSNTLLLPFTVTVTGTTASPAACLDFSTSSLDGAMTLTMGATAQLTCYGSMTLPATNFAFSVTAGALLVFAATSTGKTFTTNGVASTNLGIQFNGVGGEWTLGSALTTTNITVSSGSFVTGNFNITATNFTTTGALTRSVTLGSSTLTLSGTTGAFSAASTNLTFSSGTSTINCSNASPTFAGGGLTFYNVSFTNTAISTVTITGANTFNNLSFTARAAAGFGQVGFDSSTTVNGTLTLGSGTTGVARLFVRSTTIGTTTTLTVATLAAITDIDFRDITAAGASAPWSGTRIGNCLNNNNITFTGARTVYWVSAASANWNAAVWNTSSGTTGGATTNFPLAQDSIVIDNAGLTTGNTITLNSLYNIPNLSFATRSNAATFATASSTANFYGDYVLSSAITVSGTGGFIFAKQNGTATITSAAKTFTQPVTFNAPSGTYCINGDLTLGSTLTTTLNYGILDLTNNGAGNYVLSTGIFSSANSNTRSIAFGTGQITLTGNGAIVFNLSTSTNFSYTGTSKIVSNYSGSTGTRDFAINTAGGVGIAMNFFITAGADTITRLGLVNNLDFTGFTGTLDNSTTRFVYSNLIISSGMIVTAGAFPFSFVATSGTQQITTNGKTLDVPVTQNGVGGTVKLQDALTIGSTRAYTLTNGTLDLNNLTLTIGNWSSVNSNTRAILFGTGNITITNNNTSVFSMSTATGFTYTGTPNINFTYSGSTGTRTITFGSTGGTETNALNFNVNAGSDIVVFSARTKNLNFAGFSGTLGASALTMFGNLLFNSGMFTSSGGSITFASTSGTQQITTAGLILDFSLLFNGLGGTFAFQDALTMGSTRTLTLSAGTLLLKSGTTNTVGTAVLSGNAATNTKLGATTPGFAAFLQKVIGGTITATNITVQDSTVTPTETWYGDATVVNGGNNNNWIFEQTSIQGHDAFLPQEIRHFKDLDRKAKAAEAARIRAVKLMAYHRKRRFKELLAPELINPEEESFYEQLREEQFPEQVAKERTEKATAEEKAKVEAKKSEIKKELKRLKKEEKEAADKVVELQREKELLIESVLQRQKAMEIQAQLAIIHKLQQEEMEDEQALLLLI